MDLILVGPGRAGLAVALATASAEHRIVGVLARRRDAAAAAASRLESAVLEWDRPLPGADLLLIGVRDDAITTVARRLAGREGAVSGAAHLSGFTPVDALGPLSVPIASFHPLQTLPTPEVGAARLAGAWVAVTSDDDMLADRLFAFAASLGARPFDLADRAKPLYHAAAVAAANFPVASWEMSRRLFAAAGVEFAAAAPLIQAITANTLDLGPEAALTGPIARGDVGTVRAQVEAVRAALPEFAAHFDAAVRAVAQVAGTSEEIEEALG